ncbi:MAG: porin [Deltaproteobacteria bacterium]|nr:porin [Deltaproteobacteria bacterium]
MGKFPIHLLLALAFVLETPAFASEGSQDAPPAQKPLAPEASPGRSQELVAEAGSPGETSSVSVVPVAAVEREGSAPDSDQGVTVAGIQFTGLLDAYVSLNPARGPKNSAQNELHAFDTFTNDLSFSYAELALERKPSPVGFRLDLGFGPTGDAVNATDAATGEGADLMRNIQQAYLIWQAAPKLSFRVGKMVTHHGFEVIESQGNWNYTRGILFTWAIPFTSTGIGASYALSGAVDMSFFLVNGLNNTLETNDFKSPCFQLVMRPSSSLSITANYQLFNEKPGEEGGVTKLENGVHLLDLIAAYSPTAKLELAVNADVGYDASIDDDKTFFGVAGYARYHLAETMDVAARAEYFQDGRSSLFGLPGDEPGKVFESTATFSYAPASGLLLRTDLRLDQGLSGYKPFTDKDGGAVASAATVTMGAVASF